MRNPNQPDVAPKACLFRDHLFRLRFGGDTDLRDVRALQRIHQRDQFLHRQFAVGPDHHSNIRIGPLQLDQLRSQRVRIDNLIIQLDRLRPIDGDGLNLRRIQRRIFLAT